MAWPFKGKPGKINIIRDSPDPGTWIRAQVTYRFRILFEIITDSRTWIRVHVTYRYKILFEIITDPRTWIRVNVTYKYRILFEIITVLCTGHFL